MTDNYRIGSLCSGYGGLDEGLAQVIPCEPAWFCEFADGPSKILAHNYPGVPNHRDLTQTDWSTVEPVDIVTAGFPCQPFSYAGQRAGERDERHLWPHILEAIRFLRPKYAFLENVPGLITSGGEFVEPIDRCVCGWPYRRGGRDIHREGGCSDGPSYLLGACGCGDDNTGTGCVANTSTAVRRNDIGEPRAQREMGGRAHMVDQWSVLRGDAHADSPIPATQGGAGGPGAEGRGHKVGDARKTQPLVAGIPRTVRDAEKADARVEQTRACDPATGERITVCPSCGRAVGDDAVRSVFRFGLGEVVRTLSKIGYDAQWCCVRASDVGAPHRRERVFILAEDTNGAVGGEWWQSAPIEAESRGAWSDAGRRARASATDADLEGSQGGKSAWRPDVPTRRAPTDAAGDGRHEGWTESVGLVGGSDAAERSGASPPDADRGERDGRQQDPQRGAVRRTATAGGRAAGSGGKVAPDTAGAERRGTQPEHLVSRSAGTTKLGERLSESPERGDSTIEWGAYRPAIERWQHVLGRPAPAPTEPGPRGGQRLSPLLVEFLMGLPAGWVTGVPGLSRNEQLKALGNGVVPQQCAAAFTRLLNIAEVAA